MPGSKSGIEREVGSVTAVQLNYLGRLLCRREKGALDRLLAFFAHVRDVRSFDLIGRLSQQTKES